MRRKTQMILIIISSVIILVGAILTGIVLDYTQNRDNTTKVSFSKNTTEEAIEFRDMLIHPGETYDCSIYITNKIEGECRLNVIFDEYKPNLLANELKKYLYVTVTFDGDVIADGILLEELFNTELPVQNCVLDAEDPLELKLSFHMPSEIGNEAEFTEAFFDLIIKVSNE